MREWRCREKMKITIIAVGNLKEKYWKDAAAEYSKRLSSYCDLEIVEIKEAKLAGGGKSAGSGSAAEEKVKEEEGQAIVSKIPKDAFVVTLEIQGKKYSSEKLAEEIESLALQGKSHIVFIIGGSLGLSKEVSKQANLRLSFSDMTFPHQMMRVILLEQIYRAFKINRNETYHK